MSLDKPNDKSKQKQYITRRGLLTGMAAVAGAGIAGGIADIALTHHERESVKKEVPATAPERPHEKIYSFLTYEPSPQLYDTGELAGMKSSELLAKYLGIEGVVPKQLSVDFKYLLAQMWKEKIERVKRSGKDTTPCLETAQALFDSFDQKQPDRIDLAGYEQQIGQALHEVRLRDLSPLKKIPAFDDLDDTQMELLKRFESAISAKMMGAYAMTEIIPVPGSHGVALFEFFLDKVGMQYINAIPARYDSLLSFGPYQFTVNALDEHETVITKKKRGKAVKQKHFVKNGASLINSLLPRSQIPAHVAELRGADHHKAAYLFALYNFTRLVEQLGSDDSDTPAKLLKYFDELPPDTILEFMATAHHLPGNAIDAFEEYAAAFTRFKESPPETKHHGKPVHGIAQRHSHVHAPTFLEFCKVNGLGDYCEKTKSNMDALRARSLLTR